MGNRFPRWLSGITVALALQAAAQERVTIPGPTLAAPLSAHWFPVDGAAPRPAVVTLHGCDGALDDKGQLAFKYRRYAGYFHSERMHVLALDSFSPRGLGSICATANNRRTVFEEDRREDVYAALRWLAAQPGVDPSRLVVLGWSHGAQTVLSVMDATDRFVQAQAVRPRAAIAFYPGCIKFQRMFNYELVAPLLLMTGALDDWTPAAECIALGRRLAVPGKPAFELEVYPDSHHGFDSASPVTVRKNAGNSRSGEATAGGNPVAHAQSHARLFDFLSAQLQEPLAMAHAQRMRQRVRPASAASAP